MYGNTKKQAKAIIRKGLALVKLLYQKYASDDKFINFLSQEFTTLVSDQIALLSKNYVKERSSLLDIFCMWAS